MTTIYKCDVCDKEFDSAKECRVHEGAHFHGVNRIKYNLIHNPEADICDYCDCSYYVYGVERDCEHKDCNYINLYADFVPTEPLHDKSKNGGI